MPSSKKFHWKGGSKTLYRKRKRSSKKTVFPKSKKRKTWTSKTSKRHFRKRGLSTRVNKLSRKVMNLPQPARNIYVDQYAGQSVLSNGMTVYTGLAFQGGGVSVGSPLLTTNALIPLFTCSPMDPGLLLGAMDAVIPNPGWIGANKILLHKYRMRLQVTNINNSPYTFTRHTLRVKSDVPATYYSGESNFYNGAACFEYWFSHTARVSLPSNNTGTFNTNLNELTAVGGTGGWAPPVLSTAKYAAATMPGFALTDNPVFNQYFKIVKSRKHTIQPGQSITLTKASKKPTMIDTSRYVDAGIYQDEVNTTLYSLKILAKKGTLIDIYHVEGIPGVYHSMGEAGSTITGPYVQWTATYNYHFSEAATGQYNFTANTALPYSVGVLNIIRPGDSAITALASAD